jgi:hypothetical protein
LILDVVEAIDLEELDLHTCPYLAYQLLMFVTINWYVGGNEIERTMITQKTQGFSDRFGPLRG